MTAEALKRVIIMRRQAKVRRENQQIKLIPDADIFHETIATKLFPLNNSVQVANFALCGTQEIYRTCRDCGRVEKYFSRCNIKWCPRCQWRVTLKRQQLIQAWAKRIRQPKHLVTTQSNFPILTRRTIREHVRNLARFRRRKVFKSVRGGCVSTEITNEQRGWHLHAHWLLDVDWLDMAVVSQVWGKIVGQNFAIVKVKDVRGGDYVAEIVKYLAKGSEIASWEPDQINEFVTAIRGCRFFGSFGALRDLAPAIRAELLASKPPPPVCECGCSQFQFGTDESEVIHAASRA
jgi:hypothetical protein